MDSSEIEPEIKDDAWVYEPGRTEVFQAWLDSLESREVRRMKAREGKPTERNYASTR